MSFIFSFFLGFLFTIFLILITTHFYLKGYISGFVDMHKKDLKFLNKLPKPLKKLYGIKIDE